MADAPTPRRSETRHKFGGAMNTQDGRYGVEDNEFFYLENIMLVAEGKLRSIPGPSAALISFPLPTPPFDFLLLETGDHILLEDGGKIILNG